jgi:hypothetical protein
MGTGMLKDVVRIFDFLFFHSRPVKRKGLNITVIPAKAGMRIR